MSTKNDLRQFLMSRRANITPQQAGMRTGDEDRRVPGLRREEVAMLAGVSLDYYTRIEKGAISGASDSVLNAIATALQLTDTEREHLHSLARKVPTKPSGHTTEPSPKVRDSVQRMIDGMDAAAIVQTRYLDIIAANHLGRALFAPVFDTPLTPNFARFNYLDPRSRDFYVDWPLARRTGAAILRLEAGRDPLNEELTALIGELSTLSPYFREDWARRDVHEHRTGTKAFRHPAVGELTVSFDVFETPGDSNQKLVTYSAPAGTETAEKFAILASWAAQQEDTTASDTPHGPAESH